MRFEKKSQVLKKPQFPQDTLTSPEKQHTIPREHSRINAF